MSRAKELDNRKKDLSRLKPEFRQDIVSGDWILVASGREDYFKKVLAKRREEVKKSSFAKATEDEVKTCPFENPQKTGNPKPVLWYSLKNNSKFKIQNSKLDENDWFLQIIPNKYPSVETHYGTCPSLKKLGPYSDMDAIGFHEVVITRDHSRTIALFKETEIETVINGYKERYLALSKEKCLRYIFIFHNSGKEAGASVPHPHSQIMGLPIIPSDVQRSLDGCNNYFEKNKKCVHCETIEWEQSRKERVIYQNSDFIAISPYASRVNFEIRIFPLKHNPNFEKITSVQIKKLAESFKAVFKKIYDKLENPPYNFFIHTASLSSGSKCYHWHIEILPRISIWAGFELGTGIEVVFITPEKAAKILK